MFTSDVTAVTEVQSTSTRLFAGMWRHLVSVFTTLLCYDYLSLSSVVSRAFSACIRQKFAASIAEPAHEEKSRTQSLSHSPSLSDAPGTEALALRNNFILRYVIHTGVHTKPFILRSHIIQASVLLIKILQQNFFRFRLQLV